MRQGSEYREQNAWLPFRFAESGDPFEPVESIRKRLMHPLLVREWMATDRRTPDHWIAPLLTAPFDEGVAGAKGAQKAGDKTE